MKTTKINQAALSVILFVGIALFSFVYITSCLKKSEDNPEHSSGKLKSDTASYQDSVFVITIPLQNQLSLIKDYFGPGILDQLQSKYDGSITDFTILSDTITMQNDTLVQYLMDISCSEFRSKQFSVLVNHTRGEKSVNAPLGVVVKTYWIFSCNQCQCTGSCQILPNGVNTTCLCTQYYDCCLNTSVVCFFYWNN
jgi:hypothetical protein